jgi:penicillin-binding protein 2
MIRTPPPATVKNVLAEALLFRARTIQALALAILAVIVIIGRYAQLQLIEHEELTSRSERNRIKLQPVAPARGLIYDRNGVLLADNRPAFRLEIVPERVEDLDATLAQLRDLVAIDPDDEQRLKDQIRAVRRFQPVPLKFDLSEVDVARIAVNRHRLPGVDITPYQTRQYLYGELYAHVVGYVGRIDAEDQARLDSRRYAGSTHVGKTGLERFYEDLLHGAAGFEQLESNAAGRPLRVLSRTPPSAGNHLYLSIDHRLQMAMVQAFGQESGAAMAVDPRNGEVLAMVSLPSFDPNPFVRGIGRSAYAELRDSPDRPLFNRVIQGGYEPGSTIKPLMVLAGLELGLRRPDQGIASTGQFRLPGNSQVYRDWRAGGHGWVDAREAIAQSVNTYFYQLAVEMGVDRMSEYLGQFGFGTPTGLDLLGETRGVLPSREWKQANLRQPWYLGETVIAGIGQGYWVTSMPQLAQALSILAMRGERAPLHLLRATQEGFEAPTRHRETSRSPAVPVRTPSNWDVAIDGMVAVVHGPTGTARSVGDGLPFTVAGKTGTAQRVSRREGQRSEDLARHLRHQALFVALAPAEAPEVVVVVIVEGGGSGSRTAAPVARQILDAWWSFRPGAPESQT